VFAVSARVSVYGPETVFAVPERNGKVGRRRSIARPDRKPESVRALAERLPARAWKTLPCRTTPAGDEVSGRFAFVRVVATHPVRNDHQPPREEWLIIEWPKGDEQPCDYWLSNLPPEASAKRLARLARLRWTIELDYRQLKGELGLDHYEGRSYLGFHHHTALVTCAHAFLTLERLDPKAPQPA
jgi:SRSO17 transposase